MRTTFASVEAMAELRFRPAAELWPLVDRAFQYHSREILTLVPNATVEHVGATAVPAALTKGDVDLLVRVPPDEVEAAVAALAGRYPDLDGELPVDVEVVAEGSPRSEQVLRLRRELRRRPELVERSNELKLRYEGADPDAYEAAKQAFYATFL